MKILRKETLKKRSFWISLVVILVMAGAGIWFTTTRIAAAKTAKAEEPALQTAVARQGELVVMASGTGQVTATSTINISFDASGTLIELNVVVGDKVSKGDVLARLQTKDTPESIQASLASAELAVTKAQNALDDLYATAETTRATALNDIATYAQVVRDAQYQLENYTTPTTFRGLSPIEAFDLMNKQLYVASKAFEPYRGITQYDKKRQELLVKLNDAQSNYDSAVKSLEYEYQLEVAEANLKNARQEYDAYKDGPAKSELKQAEDELAIAQAQLALTKETMAVVELTAPMDATIMSISANVGEYVSEASLITLADLDHYMLDVSLDQTDLDKIAVGYQAEVTFDALPDNKFTGKVVAVDPSLATVSNVQVIKASVLLDQANLPSGVTLPIGLTASVDVIAGQANNAVLVPVEALRQIDPGEYAVFVMNNGELKLRTVTVGLMDLTSAQIVSGLEPGEIVSTGVVQTKQSQ
jgi:RND family efflux transporter MFP subunit